MKVIINTGRLREKLRRQDESMQYEIRSRNGEKTSGEELEK